MADTVESLEIQITHRASGAASALRSLTSSLKSVSKATQPATSALGNFVNSLKRIAFYRFIRSIIKGITQAFQEGLQQAYIFSSGIAGEGHRFAEALDSMKASGNQLKGQLGAAFAALLTAIEPILTKIINLCISVADAISQLLSAFTGTKYLKANKTAAQFADTMKSGAGAAKEWKNQLLSFDEINRLNEPSNGGGGGGSSAPSGFAFEDADINPKLLEFINLLKERLQPAIDRCKEAFERLKTAWENLTEAFSQDGVLRDLTLDLLTLGGDLIINTVTTLVDTLTLLLDVLTALQTGDWSTVWEDLKLVFTDLWTTISDLIWDGLILLADAIDALIPGEQHLADTMRALKNGTWEVTTTTADGAKEVYTFEQAAADASAKLNGTYKPSVEQTEQNMKWWADAAQAASEKLNGTYIPSMDLAKTNMENFEKTIGGLNKAFEGLGFKKSLHVEWSGGTAHIFGQEISWNLPSISWYAQGGFPDEGQLFIANEAGAEMVGSIGGRTAVANNDQIVEGIRQGVYEAVMAANSNGNNSFDVRVFLDSREIKTGQQRLARSMGVG